MATVENQMAFRGMARKGSIGLIAVAAIAMLLAGSPAPARIPALAAVPEAPAQGAGRIVAIGDVHGDYDALVGILQEAGVIDANMNWSGGKTTLVQTGDFLDRGPKVREVMDLLMALEKQAPKKGGRVVVLLGNHEVMNMIGDLRDVTSANYASFAGPDAEKKRASAWKSWAVWQKSQKPAGTPQAEPASAPAAGGADEAAKQKWMETHPAGYVEHRAAFGPSGRYGKWLRSKAVVATLGGMLFVHGGISPALASWKPADLNATVKAEIASFDRAVAQMEQQRWVAPYANINELVAGAQGELERLKAAAAAAPAGGEEPRRLKSAEVATQEPDPKQSISFLEEFLKLGGWVCNHPEGPLWFRGYALWGDAEGEPKASAAIQALGVSQMIIGHTPQTDGRIRARFGQKIILIDTGMYTAYFKYGRPSALEIDAGKYTAIYRDQRVVLFQNVAPAAGRPASGLDEGEETEETPGGGLSAHGQGQQGAATGSKPQAEKKAEPEKKPTATSPRSAAKTKGAATAAPVEDQNPPTPAESPRLAPTQPKRGAPTLTPPKETSAHSSAAAPAGATAAARRVQGSPRIWTGPDGKPLPFKSPEEVQEFLRTAKIAKMKDIPTGITQPRKASLQKDGIQMHAVFRDMNMEKDVARMATGAMEMHFRDSYIFECAAYELAMMIGLDNVPPVVSRRVNSTDGSLQIWIENAMRETDRQKKKIQPPDPRHWNQQVQTMRLFDQLIYNTDRNMGNILIDPDWQLWMIDHTRAFRRHDELRDPVGFVQVERGVWEKLKNLNRAEAEQRLRPYLRKFEIEAVLKRREILIQYIERLVAEKGEDKVFFTW